MRLPDQVGEFSGEDQEVSEAERLILPKDTEFAKKLYTTEDNESITSQIVLAGAEQRSIHRPEVCLPGQGWTVKSSEILPVTLNDGRVLDVMCLKIARPISGKDGSVAELTSLFMYWFVGSDMTTPSHMTRILRTNLDRLLHNTTHRWAYMIVSAPVLKGFVPGAKDEAQTLETLEQFIAEMAPAVMKPEILKEG